MTSNQNKRTFFILWILCIIGSWSVLPYSYLLGILPSDVPVWKIASLATIQAILFFGLICWISYKILPKTDLDPFHPLFKAQWLKKIVYPSVIAGVLVGLTIFIFDKTLFNNSLISEVHPRFWAGALASIYGAINEEVLLRLFLFTLIYFLVGKCITINGNNRLAILWTVNIFVALIFGIGHLPAAFKMASPSALEIFRILFLNGIAGIVFGSLYWSKGLIAAMIAHFVTDIIIHILLI